MGGDDIAGTAAGTVKRKDLRVTTIPVRRADVLMQRDSIPCDLGAVAFVIGEEQTSKVSPAFTVTPGMLRLRTSSSPVVPRAVTTGVLETWLLPKGMQRPVMSSSLK